MDTDLEDDKVFMQQALALARQARDSGEVPVGAVVVFEGQVIGQGFNRPLSSNDPTAHAEIVAIRDAAAALDNYRLPDTTLYVTLEPCSMCIGAMMHARIGRLVYGASEPRAGAVNSAFELATSSKFNHAMSIDSGVLANESSLLLKQFFAERRKPRSPR